jgi:hypothetical protein
MYSKKKYFFNYLFTLNIRLFTTTPLLITPAPRPIKAPYTAETIPYPSPFVCDTLCTPNPASIIVVIKNAGEKPMSTNDLRVSRAIGSINLKY